MSFETTAKLKSGEEEVIYIGDPEKGQRSWLFGTIQKSPGPHMICDLNGKGLKWSEVENGMEVKIKALEADASKKTEGLRVQVIDAIQRSVEKCTRKYVDNLDDCFPSATYIFSCDESNSPADADQGEAASQQTQSSVKRRIESADSVADNEDDSK